MDTEYFGRIEIALDDLRTRVKALEEAVTQIPQINFSADPSRPQGVEVAPAPPVESK